MDATKYGQTSQVVPRVLQLLLKVYRTLRRDIQTTYRINKEERAVCLDQRKK